MDVHPKTIEHSHALATSSAGLQTRASLVSIPYKLSQSPRKWLELKFILSNGRTIIEQGWE